MSLSLKCCGMAAFPCSSNDSTMDRLSIEGPCTHHWRRRCIVCGANGHIRRIELRVSWLSWVQSILHKFLGSGLPSMSPASRSSQMVVKERVGRRCENFRHDTTSQPRSFTKVGASLMEKERVPGGWRMLWYTTGIGTQPQTRKNVASAQSWKLHFILTTRSISFY